jgi:hypothetical protein
MGRFELLEAGKHTEGGRVYRKGDIIETGKDLCKAFPKRFRELPTPPPFIPPAVIRAPEKITPPAPPEPRPLTPPETGALAQPPLPKTIKLAKKKTGDVTASFDVDADLLQVFKVGSRYNVHAKGETKPLNEKPLARKAVAPFCNAFLEG